MAMIPAMRRPLVRISLAIVVLLALPVAGVVVFRTALVEAGLQMALRDQGFDSPSLRVSAVDLDRIVIEDLTLGGDRGLAIKRIVGRFGFDQLLTGRLGRIDIHGLRATAEVADESLVVDGLPRPSTAVKTTAPPQLPVDMLALHHGQIVARTPIGEIAIHLNGVARSAGATAPIEVALDYVLTATQGSVSGTADVVANADLIDAKLRIATGTLHGPFLAARDVGGHLELCVVGGQLVEASASLDAGQAASADRPGLSGAVHLKAHYAPDAARATLRLRKADNPSTAQINFTVDQLRKAPRWGLDAVIGLTAGSALWPALDLVSPTAGRASVEIQSKGQLPGGSLPTGSVTAESEGGAGAMIDGRLIEGFANSLADARGEARIERPPITPRSAAVFTPISPRF